MKRRLSILHTFLLLSCFAFFLSSCKTVNELPTQPSEQISQTETSEAAFSAPTQAQTETVNSSRDIGHIGLGIERNDIDGVLELNLEQHSYDILLYDNVPGGAGHVKRLVEKNAVITSLNAAYVKVSQQCCDENTSCYNCLRNYYNQTNHSKLKRKYDRDFIESLLRQIDVRP